MHVKKDLSIIFLVKFVSTDLDGQGAAPDITDIKNAEERTKTNEPGTADPVLPVSLIREGGQAYDRQKGGNTLSFLAGIKFSQPGHHRTVQTGQYRRPAMEAF